MPEVWATQNGFVKIRLHVGSVAVKAMMGAIVLQRPPAVLIARATIAHHPSPALFGYKKKISNALRQRGVFSYGDARRLVTSSSSSTSSSAAPSYASAVKSVPKKVTISVDCQTPLSWIGPHPSLRDASRLPSVITNIEGIPRNACGASGDISIWYVQS